MLEKALIEKGVDSQSIEGFLAQYGSFLSGNGYELVLGEEVIFNGYSLIFNCDDANIVSTNFYVEVLPDTAEQFLDYTARQAELALKAQMQLDYLETSPTKHSPILAVSKGNPSENILVGIADKVIWADMTKLLRLSDRMKHLRSTWHAPGHLAASGLSTLQYTPHKSLKIAESASGTVFASVLKYAYEALYANYSVNFIRGMKPSEAINAHYTHQQTHEGIIRENQTLVTRLLPRIWILVVNLLVQMLGRPAKFTDLERLDLDSIKHVVRSLAFAPNGFIGGSGSGVKSLFLEATELEGRFKFHLNRQWAHEVQEAHNNNLLLQASRRFVDGIDLPLDKYWVGESYGRSIAHTFGATGACPLGGDGVNGLHAYDVMVDAGYALISAMLSPDETDHTS